LTLFIGHAKLVAITVLLLEVAPVLRELATKKVIPANGFLLFEKTLVARRVQGGVDTFRKEEAKDAFTKDVQEDWVEKGFYGFG
jgi:hypothetical protein